MGSTNIEGAHKLNARGESDEQQQPVGQREVENAIQQVLERRLHTSVEKTDDIYARGLISSMFAMELVVQLEQMYSIEIIGPDLKLDNFRSVSSMTSLVLKLSADAI